MVGLWGGLTIFAFFSAAIGDMIKPFELEGVKCYAPRGFQLYYRATHRKKFIRIEK